LSLFGRFAAVGAAGFIVDATVLTAMLSLGAGFYGGRIFSFLAAATATWYANRRITFSSRDSRVVSEWARFLAASAGGGTVNYLIYAMLVSSFTLCRQHPTVGVAAGSLAGLLINFTISRYLVFQRTRD
jgi:putative flippase GtrA